MSTEFFYALMLLSALISAASQILLKYSANVTYKNRLFEYLNPFVVVAYICYIGVLFLNIFIFTKIEYRFGVVISALTMLFVLLMSSSMLKERITSKRIVGNCIIALGIICFTLL